MSAVILEFKTTPGRIEVQRYREDWFVFDQDHGWRPISEAVAHTLNELASDIARHDTKQPEELRQ
jgi:hypothetical protein